MLCAAARGTTLYFLGALAPACLHLEQGIAQHSLQLGLAAGCDNQWILLPNSPGCPGYLVFSWLLPAKNVGFVNWATVSSMEWKPTLRHMWLICMV